MDSSTFDSSLDYSLHFDLRAVSDLELKEISRLSYSGAPSQCYSDIDLVADEIIFRLDQIGYKIRNKEHRPFADILIYIFNILKKIKSTKIMYVYDKYNNYLNEPIPSPAMSPVKSPPVKSPPVKSPPVKSPHPVKLSPEKHSQNFKTRFMKKPIKSKGSVYQP